MLVEDGMLDGMDVGDVFLNVFIKLDYIRFEWCVGIRGRKKGKEYFKKKE